MTQDFKQRKSFATLRACPAWLSLSQDRRSFIFLPDRAAIVRRIFEASISGLGGYTIAKHFNSIGVPPFGPSDKWDQSTIHNLLRNRATIGEHQPKRLQNGKRVPDGEPIQNFYPAVIDEALFQAAQTARQMNLAFGRGRKGAVITNIFAGLPKCAYCAGPIKFYSNGKRKSLICINALNKLGCYRFAWSYKNFEDLFFTLVQQHRGELLDGLPNRKDAATLLAAIDRLSGVEVYDARVNISMILRRVVSELNIADGGPRLNLEDVTPENNLKDVKLDEPGRYFEVKFANGQFLVGTAD